MAKHRAGDRRIISISIPEETARKLDRRVGKGKSSGRSATIAKMIEEGLSRNMLSDTTEAIVEPRSARANPSEFRVEVDTMGRGRSTRRQILWSSDRQISDEFRYR